MIETFLTLPHALPDLPAWCIGLGAAVVAALGAWGSR